MINTPKELIDAIKSNNLIIWVGSGYQRSLGFPNWDNFILALADASFTESEKLEAFKIDYAHNNKKDDSDITKKKPLEILEAFQTVKEKVFSTLPSIFTLPTKGNEDAIWLPFNRLWSITNKIITTNYDTALENISNKPPYVQTVLYYKKHQLEDLLSEKGFLFKLHGCVHDSPKNCIVFQEQYDDLYKGNL